MNSIYQKIQKVRKPRVQISYELEEGNSSVKKELPFVVGVMGDYAGDSEAHSIPFKERKFIQIDGDNFNQVMTQLKSMLKLNDDNENMEVELQFNSMDDFEPDQIAQTEGEDHE